MRIVKVKDKEHLQTIIADYGNKRLSVDFFIRELANTVEVKMDDPRIKYPFIGVLSCSWGDWDYLDIDIISKVDAALLLTTGSKDE